jgi:hypothetical protein
MLYRIVKLDSPGKIRNFIKWWHYKVSTKIVAIEDNDSSSSDHRKSQQKLAPWKAAAYSMVMLDPDKKNAAIKNGNMSSNGVRNCQQNILK